MTNSLQII